jgi:hypothetical protein
LIKLLIGFGKKLTAALLSKRAGLFICWSARRAESKAINQDGCGPVPAGAGNNYFSLYFPGFPSGLSPVFPIHLPDPTIG